jgi:dTDP-4-dehydrorhamnose reductase
MKILIIGKNGQLGKSIYKVVNNSSKTTNKKNSHEFIFAGREELDLSNENNIERYFDKNRFDIIINCAAYTQVDKAEHELILANQVNHLSVKKLSHICNIQNTKLIHISTDYVFDGTHNKPYLESSIPNPINAYGKTKLDGEKAIQEEMQNNATIIRTSWVYSEYGNNFVHSMLGLAKERDELNIINDQIGSPTYATDLADVILKIIDNKEFYNNEETQIYHFSNQGSISWYEFAKETFKQAEIKCILKPISTEQYNGSTNRPKYTVLNIQKLTNKFDINIKCWRISLANCIANYI